ncbi:unnamed protein product [Rotaria magnacalcarata]|uniref:Microbial-type PARG catalytic domain-containing protein n=1 Tax=Rotaria magnacalcarata TaxID=392030 RepID=A0A819XW62_9BILA|nr:unnamed protein product [Rotaria magnacalcarata]
MDDSQNSADLIHMASDAEPNLLLSTQANIKYRPMPDPLSVYVPLNSLTEETVDSIVSTVSTVPQSDKTEWSFSRRTLLAFLLAIHNKLSRIEQNDSTMKLDRQIVEYASKVRQWLVHKNHSGNIIKELDWTELRETYDKMAKETDDGNAKYFGVKNAEPYFELTIERVHPDINQSREYMTRFRSHGWEPNELKIYWNLQQLENLCPKDETQIKQVDKRNEEKIDVNNETKLEEKCELNRTQEDFKNLNIQSKTNEESKDEAKFEIEKEVNDPVRDEVKDQSSEENNREKDKTNEEVENENLLLEHDPSDADAAEALRQYPVSKRNNAGKITYINQGIEKAVFDIPENAQIIVLNFANERVAGGGYCRHAWAQEEIILYNSDGYRSLLDLKYGRMSGGYAIPEYGLAYVRDIRFFDDKTGKDRKADMLVSACYCLTRSLQLYANPTSEDEWKTKTLAKFQAFMAAAIANTKGDGSNTYLLLGPIGTGAFGNDVIEIGNVFRKVLTSKLMGSHRPISKVFENICPHLIESKRISDSSLDLNEIVYHDEPSRIYLGSPSIIRLSSGRLVASHDFFGAGYISQPRNVSIYTSDDNGETWSFISYIKHSYWTTLAVYNGLIYAIGTNSDSNANVIIHRSNDNGSSWIYNGNDDGVILFHGSFATGPTPIVIAEQVMYRAVEQWPAPFQWPKDFQAAIISCNLSKPIESSTADDPIMSPNNWRLTTPLVFNKEWLPKSFPNLTAPGYLEGNIVIVPKSSSNETRVLNIMRFNSIPLSNLAIILELNKTTNTLCFVSITNFPGGMTKFTIRYDPVTEAYFSLVNPVTQNFEPTQRNILSLSYTKDKIHLSNWTIVADRLLYDDTGFTINDSLRYTGFHYVDWQFDEFSSSSSSFNSKASCIEWNCDGGPHIIYAIRTSYRGANSFHNSNRITYKTLKDYREMIK